MLNMHYCTDKVYASVDVLMPPLTYRHAPEVKCFPYSLSKRKQLSKSLCVLSYFWVFVSTCPSDSIRRKLDRKMKCFTSDEEVEFIFIGT